MERLSVTVIGAGVAGLCCALELAERGARVEVVDRGRALGDGACSWQAGGMLAPWCERATTDAAVADHGRAVDRLVDASFSRHRPQGQPRRRPAARCRRPHALRPAAPNATNGSMPIALRPSNPISPAASAGRCSFPTKRISIRAWRWRRSSSGSPTAASPIRFGVEVSPEEAPGDCSRRLPRVRRARRLARSARRARRDGGGALPRRDALAAGPHAASAHPALHRAARRRPSS